MKSPALYMIAFLCASMISYLLGCADDTGNNSADGGSDGDADADADGDSDGDADGDSDGDGDVFECPKQNPAKLEITENAETAGLYLVDEGLPTAAEISYREVVNGKWRGGHPLTSIRGGAALAGSLFNLKQARQYAVKITGDDLDLTACFTTVSAVPAFEPSAFLHVNASASTGGDGGESTPFNTIQAAVDAATPGTRILVADGVYHESVTFSSSGSKDAFIQVLAETDATKSAVGSGAVIDGSVELSGDVWTAHPSEAGVWSTAIDASCWYLAKDGERAYRYNDLSGLLAGLGDDDVPMSEGFYVEPDSTTLYVRSLTDPKDHVWNVPAFDRAFSADGVDWIWIEGFELRFFGQGRYGRGVDLKNSSHQVVRSCLIHGVPSGVVARWENDAATADDVRILGNIILDPPVNEWPWAAVKGTSMEGSAVAISNRRGAIVTGNRISNFFNGVYTGRWGDLENPDRTRDVDVYQNAIDMMGDDGLEPEGACINHRFRENTVRHAHMGISLAPITEGPVWVVRNLFYDFVSSSFKWSNGSAGRVFIYHNTSIVKTAQTNAMTLGDAVHHTRMRNNIFYGTRYALESSLTGCTDHDWDNDNWYTTRGDGEPHFKWEDTRYDTISDLADATGLERNGHDQSPGFYDISNGTIDIDSPNYNQGIIIPGINDDFYYGKAPDIGWFEWLPE